MWNNLGTSEHNAKFFQIVSFPISINNVFVWLPCDWTWQAYRWRLAWTADFGNFETKKKKRFIIFNWFSTLSKCFRIFVETFQMEHNAMLLLKTVSFSEKYLQFLPPTGIYIFYLSALKRPGLKTAHANVRAINKENCHFQLLMC